MTNVIGISLGARRHDFELRTRLLGQSLQVQRVGTDGSLTQATKLLKYWDRHAQAIGLGLVKDSARFGAQREIDADLARLAGVAQRVPVTTGARLSEILLEWSLRHAQTTLGHYFDNANVLFFSGLAHHRLAMAMQEYTENLLFADPLMQLGVPKMLTSLDALGLYASGAHCVSDWRPPRLMSGPLLRQWTQFVLRKAMARASVVVAPVHELDGFGLEELAGKTLITTTVNDERLARFKAAGVHLVIDAAPLCEGQVIDPALLDAMLLAATGKAPDEIADDDYLAMLADEGLQPRLLYPNGFQRTNRFAFVIHPLSQEYFKKVKPIELLSRVSPPLLMDSLEKVMAYAPPFVYSKVEGIRSPTGVACEGWLISVGGTPREIMNHRPEFTYRRLLAAADMAKKLGAQIMGLGAFTKVVGDAGVTVARRASLPITTGNSYSASGALWAAHDALLRMKLLPRPRGKGRVKFKAMIVGATGAIGAACARLMVRAAEEVTLVSPEAAKLLALKESLLLETPDARVVLCAQADSHIADMDMIVTATSGAGKKVLDIMKVKPGCVITDVARPLDLPASEVAKRPDVLVIESGEIRLPGEVQMKNIGLPRGVAYACLAETIVLALEGRFENFTVGRQIEWEKVREIYQLGLKHGMQLAAISGVNGVFSDEDIARVRTLALAARAAAAKAPAPAAPAAPGAGGALPPVVAPFVKPVRRRSSARTTRARAVSSGD
ncbi:dehydrogenase [Aquabacterium sp. OR-4]|uniref:dehydrogenase n=1 Tax=Aquabacterium sp. OR-4 TaxID=2978127 RepID=UPI0028C73D27|nr:dehydrogenase [Aquabacterium sp. OR-4]MDT7838501.1 dehydrogenase [Aquabacterium sp. OR-4]